MRQHNFTWGGRSRGQSHRASDNVTSIILATFVQSVDI